MDTAVKPVQTGRGRRRRWSGDQKLMVLQEWQTGVPLEEVCRKYAVNAAQMYRWKRSLDQGRKEPGEMVPKSQVLGLQKRVLPKIKRGSTQSAGCGGGDRNGLGQSDSSLATGGALHPLNFDEAVNARIRVVPVPASLISKKRAR